MPFTILHQDITTMKVDAIVNAANTALLQGGGVCGAIFRAAGEQELGAACAPLAPIQVGEAVITPAFNLDAQYVIHAVGPIYDALYSNECERLLAAAYRNALGLAVRNNCERVAFPLIASGTYAYPKDEALRVARESILSFISEQDMDVYLTIYEKSEFALPEDRLSVLVDYIQQNYQAPDALLRHRKHGEDDFFQLSEISEANTPFYVGIPRGRTFDPGIRHLINNLDESFSQTLIRMIDRKGMKDVDVYKRANIDRKLFSKIRSSKNYQPSKRTALALAFSLSLSVNETDDLLNRLGYTFSPSSIFDVIVRYHLEQEIYDLFVVNEALFEYDQPLLGV